MDRPAHGLTMADVATPGAAGSPGKGRRSRKAEAMEGEGKPQPQVVDEFTKATFTAAQKTLREQRCPPAAPSRLPRRASQRASATAPTACC